MTERIKKTEDFLKHCFEKNTKYQEEPAQKAYRLEHSFRVANIGKIIAEKEGMDVEAMVIGCLLHDVSYGEMYGNDVDYKDHGRLSAKISRPFLEKLQLPSTVIEDICYGIAIHVDDKADFEGVRSPFALTIGDADNIDRFDAYRIYETLQFNKFNEMPLQTKKEYIQNMLTKLEKFADIEFGTAYGKILWLEKLDFQKQYYTRLLQQIVNSTVALM